MIYKYIIIIYNINNIIIIYNINNIDNLINIVKSKMLNVALFVSGRLIGYAEYLLPFILRLKKKYNIVVFFSINSFTLDKQNDNIDTMISLLKQQLGSSFGFANFEKYKFSKNYVENRIKNNINVFSYNILSHFYNDRKNMEFIDSFEKENNLYFDVVCKTRADIIWGNDECDFILDKKDDLIIRNKHICDLRYWGHIYRNTPLMISDAFAYGNKKSMEYYCSTYDWILHNDLLMKGNYTNANEIYLTDCILQHVFYNIAGGGLVPILNEEQIIDKYINNPNKIKIVFLNNIHYTLLHTNVRHKNNFIVDINNVFDYTHI